MRLPERCVNVTKKSQLRCNFNHLADRYDQWYDSPEGFMYDRLEKNCFDKLIENHHDGKQLLEIGCGTGHWSRYFSDKGFNVTGIDISKNMIKTADKKNIAHCSFQVSDGQCLSFVDNSFDVAAAVTVLEFSKNPEKVVLEMARVVKHKGKLLFGVLNALSSYNRKRQKNTGSVYANARFFSPEQLTDLLERFGKVKMHITGFVIHPEWLSGLSPFWDYVCRSINSNKGAFIAAEVQL